MQKIGSRALARLAEPGTSKSPAKKPPANWPNRGILSLKNRRLPTGAGFILAFGLFLKRAEFESAGLGRVELVGGQKGRGWGREFLPAVVAMSSFYRKIGQKIRLKGENRIFLTFRCLQFVPGWAEGK